MNYWVPTELEFQILPLLLANPCVLISWHPPAGPGSPLDPGAPGSPGRPEGPVQPVDPVLPADPGNPVLPVIPRIPVAPVKDDKDNNYVWMLLALISIAYWVHCKVVKSFTDGSWPMSGRLEQIHQHISHVLLIMYTFMILLNMNLNTCQLNDQNNT